MPVRYLLFAFIFFEDRIMQITNDLSGNLSASSVRPVEGSVNVSFAEVFKKMVTAEGKEKEKTAKLEKSASQVEQEKKAALQTAYKAVVAELNDYVNKSPAEHIRDAVLKELGLAEEDLAKMPPEKRMAVEAVINERIREKLLGRKVAPEDEGVAVTAIDQDVIKKGAAVANPVSATLSGGSMALLALALSAGAAARRAG
jgi:hypothetical protein